MEEAQEKFAEILSFPIRFLTRWKSPGEFI